MTYGSCRKIPKLKKADIRRWLRQIWRGPETDCWIWIGARTLNGYGQVRLGGDRTKYLAHRVGYVIKNGPIKNQGIMMHVCDNPQCVNPEHLVAGTSKRNAWDRIQKGRQGGCVVVTKACPF